MEEAHGTKKCLLIPSICYDGNNAKKINGKKAFEVSYDI